MSGSVVGPWVLRSTQRRVIEDESPADGLPTTISRNDEIKAHSYDSPGIESQLEGSLGGDWDGSPWMDTGAAESHEEGTPWNLQIEMMRAMGEDVNTGKCLPIG
jgi:hypothetical protein